MELALLISLVPVAGVEPATDYKSFFPEKARSSRFAIASVGLVAKPARSREPQRGSLLAALVATEKWTLPALISHRHLRNPAGPIGRCKFLPPPPEFASCPLEREAWPRNSESPFTNSRSSRPTFSKSIASTSRSIRGSGPPRVAPGAVARRRGLPIDGKRRKLGSRISEAAGKGGGNFLTPEIAHIAPRETAYREIGALIDAERLANMNSPRVSLQLRIQLVAVETTRVLEDRCNLSRRSELNSTA
jgi:hypothetical protein